MLRIVLKDGSVRAYHNDEFTDYQWQKEVFIEAQSWIVEDGNRIVIYNFRLSIWERLKILFSGKIEVALYGYGYRIRRSKDE